MRWEHSLSYGICSPQCTLVGYASQRNRWGSFGPSVIWWRSIASIQTTDALSRRSLVIGKYLRFLQGFPIFGSGKWSTWLREISSCSCPTCSARVQHKMIYKHFTHYLKWYRQHLRWSSVFFPLATNDHWFSMPVGTLSLATVGLADRRPKKILAVSFQVLSGCTTTILNVAAESTETALHFLWTIFLLFCLL